jgi:hypothetical protein
MRCHEVPLLPGDAGVLNLSGRDIGEVPEWERLRTAALGVAAGLGGPIHQGRGYRYRGRFARDGARMKRRTRVGPSFPPVETNRNSTTSEDQQPLEWLPWNSEVHGGHRRAGRSLELHLAAIARKHPGGTSLTAIWRFRFTFSRCPVPGQARHYLAIPMTSFIISWRSSLSCTPRAALCRRAGVRSRRQESRPCWPAEFHSARLALGIVTATLDGLSCRRDLADWRTARAPRLNHARRVSSACPAPCVSERDPMPVPPRRLVNRAWPYPRKSEGKWWYRVV